MKEQLIPGSQDYIDNENGQFYGKDNPFNGTDDEEGASNYNSYMNYDSDTYNDDEFDDLD